MPDTVSGNRALFNPKTTERSHRNQVLPNETQPKTFLTLLCWSDDTKKYQDPRILRPLTESGIERLQLLGEHLLLQQLHFGSCILEAHRYRAQIIYFTSRSENTVIQSKPRSKPLVTFGAEANACYFVINGIFAYV